MRSWKKHTTEAHKKCVSFTLFALAFERHVLDFDDTAAVRKLRGRLDIDSITWPEAITRGANELFC